MAQVARTEAEKAKNAKEAGDKAAELGKQTTEKVAEATLDAPAVSRWHARGGRDGLHSEPMGYLIAEMQHLPRSHPGATW